jgi:hypothetical protein
MHAPVKIASLESDLTLLLACTQWTTALSALPLGGMRSNPIKLRLYRGVDEDTLPETHTCTRELHVPAYSSSALFHTKLFLALAHRNDGFQNE